MHVLRTWVIEPADPAALEGLRTCVRCGTRTNNAIQGLHPRCHAALTREMRLAWAEQFLRQEEILVPGCWRDHGHYVSRRSRKQGSYITLDLTTAALGYNGHVCWDFDARAVARTGMPWVKCRALDDDDPHAFCPTDEALHAAADAVGMWAIDMFPNRTPLHWVHTHGTFTVDQWGGGGCYEESRPTTIDVVLHPAGRLVASAQCAAMSQWPARHELYERGLLEEDPPRHDCGRRWHIIPAAPPRKKQKV